MKKIAVIGQGIAGTCVSRHLVLKGIDHDVYDNNHERASTKVAGGMWNPIVFRRLTKSWRIDELLPYALNFYQDLAKELGLDLLSHHNIIRIFASTEDNNNWMDKLDHPAFSQYLSNDRLSYETEIAVDFPCGYGLVQKAGRVKLPELIRAYQDYLSRHKIYKSEKFRYDLLEIHTDYIKIKDQFYTDIIFCEGFQMINNPWFSYLPLQCNKGEVLIIKAPGLILQDVLNKGSFILPLGNDMFKVGATFEVNTSEPGNTRKARKQLLKKLSVLNCNYEIVAQEHGIRPTVSDRRPLAGTHPQYKNLHIFNGLGSKGASIAPLLANEFISYLLDGSLLSKDYDIERFNISAKKNTAF